MTTMAPNALPVAWRAFHLAKRGHTGEEYEDAYAANPAAGRFAVADGAAESSFAGLWARLLVDGFVHSRPRPKPRTCWLEPLQRSWAAEVDDLPLPWYGEVKRAEGAFATFLGLMVKPSRRRIGGPWRARAVGDSCLFQVREGSLMEAFPLSHAEDFGNRPCLLGARTVVDQGPPLLCRGRWQAGDRFLLMTDALAQWFLQEAEAGRKPWQAMAHFLTRPETDAEFAAWVEGLRDRGGLRNDDVTLLVIDTGLEAVG